MIPAIILVMFLSGCKENAVTVPPSLVDSIVKESDWAKKAQSLQSLKIVDPSTWSQATTYLHLLKSGQHVHMREPMFVWTNTAYSKHIQLDHYIYLFKLDDGSLRYIFHEYLAVADSDKIDTALAEFHTAKANNQHWTPNRMQISRYGYKQHEISRKQSEQEMHALVLKHTNGKNIIATRIVCAKNGPGDTIDISDEFEYYLDKT